MFPGGSRSFSLPGVPGDRRTATSRHLLVGLKARGSPESIRVYVSLYKDKHRLSRKKRLLLCNLSFLCQLNQTVPRKETLWYGEKL